MPPRNGIGGLLTLVELCIAPCVTPALFPDADADDNPKKYDEDREASEASEASEAKEGDEPAWHGSSVEGTLLSCDSVQPLVQKLTYDSFCDEMAQTCVEINRS